MIDCNQTALKPFIGVFERFVQRSQTSKQDKQDEVLAKSGSSLSIVFSSHVSRALDLNTMLSGEI